MKIRFNLFIYLLILGLLAGCGGGDRPGADSGAVKAPAAAEEGFGSALDENGKVPHPGKPVTITYWTIPVLPLGEEEWVKNVIMEFNKEYPEVTVDYEVISWDSREEKYQTALIGGTLPDVMMQGVCEEGPQKGGLPLDPFISKDDLDDFVPGTLENYRYPDDNKIYAIPMLGTHNSSVFINVDAYEKAGIDWRLRQKKPWTREEFIEDMKKLTVDTDGDGKTDQYGFGFGGSCFELTAAPLFSNIVYTLGGDMMNEEATASAANTRPVIAALQFYQDLLYKHKVAIPGILSQTNWDIQTWWYEGRFATYQGGGTYVINEVREYNDNVEETGQGRKVNMAVVLPIYEKDNFVYFGPGGVSVRQQKDYDMVLAAAAFAKFITNTENCKRAKDISMLPARKSSGALFEGDEAMEMAMGISSKYGTDKFLARSTKAKKASSDIWKQAIQPNLEAVIANRMTPEAAATEMEKQANYVLSTY